MNKKNPEDYYNFFTIDRKRSDPKTDLFFITFIKKHPKSGYPDSAYLKVTKSSSQEAEMHKIISEVIPDYCLKIHHLSEHERTKELFIETTDHGSLYEELDNFSKFPEHYIMKAIYQLSYALKLLHIRNIYLGNIRVTHIFISNYLKFVNFEKAGNVIDCHSVEGNFTQSRSEEGKKYLEELNSYRQVLPGIQDIREFDVWCLGLVFLQLFTGKHEELFELNPGGLKLYLKRNLGRVSIKSMRSILTKMLEVPPKISMIKLVSKIAFKSNFLSIRRFGPMCFYCFEENIMNDERGDNEIRNYFCPHFFHNGCMRKYLTALISSVTELDDLHCKFCPQPFPYELEKIVPKFDLESRFKSEKLYFRTQSFICPNGHLSLTEKLLNANLQPYKVSCQAEHRSFCSFCGGVHTWLFGRTKCKALQLLKSNLGQRLSQEFIIF